MADTSFEEFEENNHKEVDDSKARKQKIIIGIVIIVLIVLAILSFL